MAEQKEVTSVDLAEKVIQLTNEKLAWAKAAGEADGRFARAMKVVGVVRAVVSLDKRRELPVCLPEALDEFDKQK